LKTVHDLQTCDPEFIRELTGAPVQAQARDKTPAEAELKDTEYKLRAGPNERARLEKKDRV